MNEGLQRVTDTTVAPSYQALRPMHLPSRCCRCVSCLMPSVSTGRLRAVPGASQEPMHGCSTQPWLHPSARLTAAPLQAALCMLQAPLLCALRSGAGLDHRPVHVTGRIVRVH